MRKELCMLPTLRMCQTIPRKTIGFTQTLSEGGSSKCCHNSMLYRTENPSSLPRGYAKSSEGSAVGQLTSPPRKSHLSRRDLPMVHFSPASMGVMSSVRSLPAATATLRASPS